MKRDYGRSGYNTNSRGGYSSTNGRGGTNYNVNTRGSSGGSNVVVTRPRIIRKGVISNSRPRKAIVPRGRRDYYQEFP